MGNTVSAKEREFLQVNGADIEHEIAKLKTDMAKRQIEMSRAIAERSIAIQVAATRERLVWFGPMLAISTVFLYRGYRKMKASPVLFPIIPMTFALFYQADFAYGNKMSRVKDMADNILKHELHLLTVPDWHINQQTQKSTSEEPTTTESKVENKEVTKSSSPLSGIAGLIWREPAHCSDENS